MVIFHSRYSYIDNNQSQVFLFLSEDVLYCLLIVDIYYFETFSLLNLAKLEMIQRFSYRNDPKFSDI